MAKIGVVEDNEMNRLMIERRLQKKGYEVVAAVDGRDAVRMAEAEFPDIILMDLDLPVMTGTEATLEIRRNPRLKNIPIIALTAHAMEGDSEIARNAGCNEYVTKPVDFPALVSKIEELLAARADEQRASFSRPDL
jgi:two-component system cell cycle response regulator DivK